VREGGRERTEERERDFSEREGKGTTDDKRQRKLGDMAVRA